MERLRLRTEAHAEAMPAAGTTFEIAIAGGHRTKANRARVRLACYAPATTAQALSSPASSRAATMRGTRPDWRGRAPVGSPQQP